MSQIMRLFKKILQIFNIQSPPVAYRLIVVKSFDSSESYTVDLQNLTCTCKDWKLERIKYPQGDPRRLCKHIISKLDVNNLPIEILKFRESIEFYQKKEWGFKRDFNKIIELDTFTLLGDIGWIDVFDENGIRYGVKIEPFSNDICWANNKKPKNFLIIEDFITKESEKIPLPLEEEEYPQIIIFIKEVLPHKKDFFISIGYSPFIPTSNGVIYNISESKLTPEQSNTLLRNLLLKHEEDEAYYMLGKAESTPSGNENEFCIYEALRVTNNEIIVKMYGGKKYQLARNYEYIKQIKEARELKQRLKQEEYEKICREEEVLRQQQLEQKRKIAAEKDYILTQDYEGDLYDIQKIFNYPDGLSWEEYEKIKNSILSNYDTIQNLIKEYSLNISTAKFNKALKNLNFIEKDSSLNQNDWIIKDAGLNYGINLIKKKSIYMHKNIPDWYKIHIFDNTKMKLIKFDSNFNIKMTSVLFEKNKFNELYHLVKQELEND